MSCRSDHSSQGNYFNIYVSAQVSVPKGCCLTVAIKNIDKIALFESGGYSRDDGYSREDGHSRGGDWDASIRGTYGRSSSYRRKRDSMGRYSWDDRDGHAKDVIERMMQDTDDPNVKEALRQCMHVVEKA